MTQVEQLRAELADLNGVLADFDVEEFEDLSPEWMTLQSLLDRQVHLMTQLEILEGEAEVEIRLVGGAEQGNRVEATFFGGFLHELQSTVSAIVQALVSGEKRGGAYPQAVLDMSTLRVAPSAAGSFVVLLDGPAGRAVQDTLEGDIQLPPFDEALDRILDVFDAVEQDVEGDVLKEAVSDLGGHRALTHLMGVARVMARSGTGGRMTQRSPFLDMPREATITAPGANRLQELLSRTEQVTETEYVTGRLSGVRWTRGMFDLEVGEGDDREVITGRIIRDIRQAVQQAFDTVVQAELEKTTTTTQVEEEARVTYRLVGLMAQQNDAGN